MNKHTALQEYTRYVSLNVAAMLGLSLYIRADTFFVAQGVGSDGLAALNLAVPLYNIMAVVVLSFFRPDRGKMDKKLLLKTARGIVTNVQDFVVNLRKGLGL